MFLESVDRSAVEQYQIPSNGIVGATAATFETWHDWEPTILMHHGKLCCETSREWMTATDFSTLNGGNLLAGPRWLRERFKWGACSHPIHWCETVRKKTLDCGALAALAHHAFTMRGLKTYRAQFVQRFSTVAAGQWSASWSNGEPLPWTKDDLIYHEGCAVAIRDNEIKVWDSSAGWWIPAKNSDGYGSLLAIRITGFENRGLLKWGENEIVPGEWQELVL